MTQDMKVLTAWIFLCVLLAAVGTTTVPIIYSFYPWRLRPIGRLFMLQSISFALATDLTAMFMLWPPNNLLVMFWINALVFSFIAVTTLSTAIWLLARMWYIIKKGKQNATSE